VDFGYLAQQKEPKSIGQLFARNYHLRGGDFMSATPVTNELQSNGSIRRKNSLFDHDREVAQLMRDAGYPRVPILGDRDFYHVTRLASRIDAVREAARIGPSLIPLIPHILPHVTFPGWKDQEVMAVARDTLKRFGLTKTGWRYLLSMPPDRSWMLSNVPGGMEGDSMGGLVRRTQALAEISVWPKQPEVADVVLSRHLLEHEMPPLIRESLVVICRKMWEHSHTFSKRSGKYREFVSTAINVVDWVDQERPQLERTQRAFSWATIADRANQWHEEMRLRPIREAAERRRLEAEAERQEADAARALREKVNASKRWGTLIDRYQTGHDYDVIPLLNANMLIDEGERMGHCVGGFGYASRCTDGTCRIFSIRRGRESLATVEIYPTGHGPWMLMQIRGPANADVGPALSGVADRLLKKWEEARERNQPELFPEWAKAPVPECNDVAVDPGQVLAVVQEVAAPGL
jgi:hypothetical protein